MANIHRGKRSPWPLDKFLIADDSDTQGWEGDDDDGEESAGD